MTDGNLRVLFLPGGLHVEISPGLFARLLPQDLGPPGHQLVPGSHNLGLEGVDVLGDVGGGDVVVPPGRDGWSGPRGCGSPRHSYRDDGLGGEAWLELASYGEVEAAGGGDSAGGLDRVRAETLGLLGLQSQLVARDGGGLVPTEALVNAGVLVVRLLKVKKC